MLDSSTAVFKPDNQNSIVKPYLLSHGTLECRDLKESRRFYEEFLGLECVRHAQQAMHARCGIKFSIVCVEVGKDVSPMGVLNHWGLDVESREQVDYAYRKALELKNKYNIGKVTEPTMRHGIYSFYLEDLDGNYWEIQYYDGLVHDDAFDFGDRFE
jgi:predicted lactoylglutathione lyase